LVVTPVGLATFLAVCDFLTKWERWSNPQLEMRIRTLLQP
jgi:hypothetical protein